MVNKVRADLSHDFNTGDSLPIPDPRLGDRHGTRCAGQISAIPNNGICGVGVAYDAELAAIRILSDNLSVLNEANAVTFGLGKIDIYSCSWGPTDNGKAVDGPAAMVLEGFVKSLVDGRDGKGSLFIFASGNGRWNIDNCNYDGYANGVFSITIGAIGEDDGTPVYMEPCSAQLAVTYSSNEKRRIVTTDLGGKCTMKHGGTSASAPLAAGIYALLLSAYPELTWRDVQALTIKSAKRINIDDRAWVQNSKGRWYSERYGFGKMDAEALLSEADGHQLLNPPILISLPYKSSLLNAHYWSDQIVITDQIMKLYSLDKIKSIEHITVTFETNYGRRGELQFRLKSPSNTTIRLATKRFYDLSSEGLVGWTMMTVGFWGETLIEGPWTLMITGAQGLPVDINWRLSIWGESRDSDGFSKSLYTKSFLENYYPSSSDYFKKNGDIWYPKNAPSFPEGVNKGERQGLRGHLGKYLLFYMLAACVVSSGFLLFWWWRSIKRERKNQVKSHYHLLDEWHDSVNDQILINMKSLH